MLGHDQSWQLTAWTTLLNVWIDDSTPHGADIAGIEDRIVGCRGVAQSGSASGLGPEGRRFESYRPDQNFPLNIKDLEQKCTESFLFSVNVAGLFA